MAARKPKAELVAIYRLEFYKKQKNWKLSDTRREREKEQITKPVSPVKHDTILNETYSIEHEDIGDCNLNDAFVDTGSGDQGIGTNQEPNTPDPPTLRIQSLEPVTACQECKDKTRLDQQTWDQWVHNQVNMEQDLDGCQWPVRSVVWSNSGLPQEVCEQDISPPAEMRQHMECPEQPPALAWPDDQLWMPDTWGEELTIHSLVTAEEFLVGAHCAPHSSEIELCVTAADADVGELSRLSSVQLATQLRRHTHELRTLLKEAGHRQKCRSTLSLDTCAVNHMELPPRAYTNCSFEDLPTRDIDTCDPPANKDPFVAGSHRNKACLEEFVGRGRGRLANMSSLPLGNFGVGRGKANMV